jgi:lipid II:glycine glycyltransferase (peptidoglycan interpeptide bridge formation enzyme)
LLYFLFILHPTNKFQDKVTINARILKMEEMTAWDDFVLAQSRDGGPGNIHQISDWGRFQQAGRGGAGMRNEGLGHTSATPLGAVDVVGVFEGEKLIGGGLVLKRMMGMGKCWLYCPKGPIFASSSRLRSTGKKEGEVVMDLAVEAWLKVVDGLAKREKAVFLRVEPGLVENGPTGFGMKVDFDWKKAGLVAAHAHYQPENTLVVDLRGSEEDILAQMKAKGRYNIKLAEKKGVEVIEVGVGEIGLKEGVAAFHNLLKETTERDKFGGHTANYYLKMLEILGPERAKLYLARYEGEIIAGVLVTFFGDLAIYYFGASGNRHRNVMAPYLLQWRAMLEAKKRGCRWYDFLGTAPLKEGADGEFTYDEGHEWAGVTGFKLKFGGEKVDFYPGAEKVYDKLIYWAMKMRKRVRN